jgi:hypothetical protein
LRIQFQRGRQQRPVRPPAAVQFDCPRALALLGQPRNDLERRVIGVS